MASFGLPLKALAGWCILRELTGSDVCGPGTGGPRHGRAELSSEDHAFPAHPAPLGSFLHHGPRDQIACILALALRASSSCPTPRTEPCHLRRDTPANGGRQRKVRSTQSRQQTCGLVGGTHPKGPHGRRVKLLIRSIVNGAHPKLPTPTAAGADNSGFTHLSTRAAMSGSPCEASRWRCSKPREGEKANANHFVLDDVKYILKQRPQNTEISETS